MKLPKSLNKNLDKPLKMLLKSELVLYIIISIVILNLIGFVKANNNVAIVVFLTLCLGMTLVTENKRIILLTALFITYVMLHVKLIKRSKARLFEGAKFSRRDSKRSFGDILRCLYNCITNENPCPSNNTSNKNIGMLNKPKVVGYQEGFVSGEDEPFVDSQPKAVSNLANNKKRVQNLTKLLPSSMKATDASGAKKQLGDARKMMTMLGPMIDQLEDMLSKLG